MTLHAYSGYSGYSKAASLVQLETSNRINSENSGIELLDPSLKPHFDPRTMAISAKTRLNACPTPPNTKRTGHELLTMRLSRDPRN